MTRSSAGTSGASGPLVASSHTQRMVMFDSRSFASNTRSRASRSFTRAQMRDAAPATARPSTRLSRCTSVSYTASSSRMRMAELVANTNKIAHAMANVSLNVSRMAPRPHAA